MVALSTRAAILVGIGAWVAFPFVALFALWQLALLVRRWERFVDALSARRCGRESLGAGAMRASPGFRPYLVYDHEALEAEREACARLEEELLSRAVLDR